MFGINRSFKGDIEILKNKLQSMEPFTFSKFADGEWSVITGESVNNGEFRYDSCSSLDIDQKLELVDAFKYRNKNYYVGISCPCCQNISIHNKMKEVSGQQESSLTWANIWVNSNYGYFINSVVPVFDEYDIFIVANENSRFERLPFVPKKIYPVSNNAWVSDYGLIDDIKRDIQQSLITRDVKNYLFLFCCGPFGNILAHQLNEFYPNYTYLDIGSTLNPYLGTGFYRGYYGEHSSMKDCIWG